MVLVAIQVGRAFEAADSIADAKAVSDATAGDSAGQVGICGNCAARFGTDRMPRNFFQRSAVQSP
jgi:hypothetical protein